MFPVLITWIRPALIATCAEPPLPPSSNVTMKLACHSYIASLVLQRNSPRQKKGNKVVPPTPSATTGLTVEHSLTPAQKGREAALRRLRPRRADGMERMQSDESRGSLRRYYAARTAQRDGTTINMHCLAGAAVPTKGNGGSVKMHWVESYGVGR
jgi:hypothetical protein